MRHKPKVYRTKKKNNKGSFQTADTSISLLFRIPVFGLRIDRASLKGVHHSLRILESLALIGQVCRL